MGLLLAIPSLWCVLAWCIGLGLPPGTVRRRLPFRRARYRRLLPVSFAVLALLSLLGGLLHAPNNFDALMYRMSRVCHWLMAERWEWISTYKNNLNTRAVGFEWWTAPMLALLRTDRLLFLLNWVSFLFLPGLIFGLFRGMGVRGRVAAQWMWVIPSGYCFVLQAASVGNDMITAMFAVAAFDFGFRWRRGGGFRCFALSLLCVGMMTAIKPITLPLLLPYAVLFHGMWRTAWQERLRTLAVVVGCAFASFLPMAAINTNVCGDWTGAAAEDQKLGSVTPWVGLVGNTVNAVQQNLVPPVFPFANAWSQWVASLFPRSFLDRMSASFEPGGDRFLVPDFTGEEMAGAGVGITLLLLLSVAAASVRKPQGPASSGSTRRMVFLLLLFGGALAAYFSRAGMTTVGRHIAAYYPFLWGACLVGDGHVAVARSKFWKWSALVAVASSAVLVIITPSRPLWPSRWFFSQFPDPAASPILQRAKNGYAVYSNRADGLGPVRDALPADATDVGLANFSIGPDLPLWKPYLRRKVRHVKPGDPIRELAAQGMLHLIVHTRDFEVATKVAPEDWVHSCGGTVVSKLQLQLLVKEPPSEWWVVRLPRPDGHQR